MSEIKDDIESEIVERMELVLAEDDLLPVDIAAASLLAIDAVAPELERLADKVRTQDQLLTMQADALDKLEALVKSQADRIADLESRLGDNF